jgi:hypothetical protein
VSLPVIFDAAPLVGGWLRDHDDLIALDARVAVGELPRTTTRPWVRITELDALPIARTRLDHAIRYAMQFDCYAGEEATAAFEGRREASLLVRTVRAILRSWEGTTRDEAVIAAVRILGCPRVPDADYEPARERYALTAEILMHP